MARAFRNQVFDSYSFIYCCYKFCDVIIASADAILMLFKIMPKINIILNHSHNTEHPYVTVELSFSKLHSPM